MPPRPIPLGQDNELSEMNRPYILLGSNQRQNRENQENQFNEQEISRQPGPNQNQFNHQANPRQQDLFEKIKSLFSFTNTTAIIVMIIAYFILPYFASDDNYYCRRSIINSKIPLQIETEIKMIDFYTEIRSDLIKKMEDDGQNFFLLEGHSMQGKSTFGKLLYNDLIQNSKIFAFYIPLDGNDPINIFKKFNKCSLENFESIINKYESDNNQIVFIIDNIQLPFEMNKTEIFSIFRNMRSKKVQFIFISSANSIIEDLRYISGFYKRVEPISLKIELQKNSSYYKDLMKALKLNEKETDTFLEHFGLDFSYINKWSKLLDHDLPEFISIQKNLKKVQIRKSFKNYETLFAYILDKMIHEWKLKGDEIEFLKKINLIVEDDFGNLNYYDNLSKISLDDMRNEKKIEILN